MATHVQENSLAGNMFKEKIAWSQSGLTNIPLFLIYVFQVLYICSTFTCYFCLNHYITENRCPGVHYNSEQCCGIYIFIFLYLKNFNIDYFKNNVLLVRPLCLSALH